MRIFISKMLWAIFRYYMPGDSSKKTFKLLRPELEMAQFQKYVTQRSILSQSNTQARFMALNDYYKNDFESLNHKINSITERLKKRNEKTI